MKRHHLYQNQPIPAYTQLELDEMDSDYRAEKRAEGDDEVRESRRHADESLCYEHE
mgnify:CR=1 FL=1